MSSSSRGLHILVCVSVFAMISCAWLSGLNVGLERRPVPPEPMTIAEVLEQVKALQKRLSEMTPAEREEFDRRMANDQLGRWRELRPLHVGSRSENTTTLEDTANSFDVRFPEIAKQLVDAGIPASRSLKGETVSVSFSRRLSPTERLVWYIGGTPTAAWLDYYLERRSRNQQFGGRVTFTDDPDDMSQNSTMVSRRSGKLERCVQLLIADVKDAQNK